jgi:hypothetical protein
MPLADFLSRSRATAAFHDAVAEFTQTHRSNDRIHFDGGSPPVKVERTLTQLLRMSPELEIERIEIRGASGCEYFRGELVAHTAHGRHVVRFHWDCKWKAQEQGWSDCFGFPDQGRAAREFGYDCFRGWAVVEMEPVSIVA